MSKDPIKDEALREDLSVYLRGARDGMIEVIHRAGIFGYAFDCQAKTTDAINALCKKHGIEAPVNYEDWNCSLSYTKGDVAWSGELAYTAKRIVMAEDPETSDNWELKKRIITP